MSRSWQAPMNHSGTSKVEHDGGRSLVEHDLDLALHRARGEHGLNTPELGPILRGQGLPARLDRAPRGRVRVDQGRRHQEVDHERPVRGAADGPDLVPQDVGHEADPAQAAEAARFADRGDERCLRHSGHAHGRDGVLDAPGAR